MLSRDLEHIHFVLDRYRKGGMHLAPDVVVHLCDAIGAMTGQARELEAACQLAGARPQGGLPDNVEVLRREDHRAAAGDGAPC